MPQTNGLKNQIHAHPFPKIKNLSTKPGHPARWLQDWAGYVLQISGSIQWHTVLVKPHHPHSRKVSQHANLLRWLSWFLPFSLLVLYIKTYILLCVDYCDVVWDCCSKQDSNCLQTLFNYACRIALHHPRLSSSSALWKYLGLSSLSTRRKLHLAQLILNSCHNSLVPLYPSSLFHKPSHRYSTSNSNRVNLPLVLVCEHLHGHQSTTAWQ